MNKITEIPIDFVVGADPIGYASIQRGQTSNKDNQLTRRIAGDIGGFTLGAGVSTALSAAALYAASKLSKNPHVSKALLNSSKETTLLLNPKKAIRSVKAFPKAMDIIHKDIERSKAVDKVLQNLDNASTSGGADLSALLASRLEKGDTISADKLQNLVDAYKIQNAEKAAFKEKYGKNPVEAATGGGAVLAGAATGVLGGTLNAITSDIQFSAGVEKRDLLKRIRDGKD